MNIDPVEAIANAVLYEGFLLYPYRLSAVKNRQRWNFGVLFPPAFSSVQEGFERQAAQTECLFEGAGESAVRIAVRFLHALPEGVVERKIEGAWSVRKLAQGDQQVAIHFGTLTGMLEVRAEALGANLFRLHARVSNTSAFGGSTRDGALGQALISCHVVWRASSGRFVSQIDPHEALREQSAACRNDGLWPVLAGAPGEASALLAAPIILEDYPRVAPQSPHDLFDGTEIDEILTLRILTLTESEKDELRNGDSRARQLLEQTEKLTAEDLRNLHGMMRCETPSTRTHSFKKGDRVRLNPTRRADVFDIALKGMIAIVETVEEDFENRQYVSVSIEDDPGRDLGAAGKPGHRFYFGVEEVERL